jgi:hypothetical protein
LIGFIVLITFWHFWYLNINIYLSRYSDIILSLIFNNRIFHFKMQFLLKISKTQI